MATGWVSSGRCAAAQPPQLLHPPLPPSSPPQPGAGAVLVGGDRVEHILSNVETIAQGPLPADLEPVWSRLPATAAALAAAASSVR